MLVFISQSVKMFDCQNEWVEILLQQARVGTLPLSVHLMLGNFAYIQKIRGSKIAVDISSNLN